MIDFNKPVQTRDGRKVEIKEQHLRGSYPILGVVIEADGTRWSDMWARDGRRHVDYSQETDLINVPERVERWVCVGDPVESGVGYMRSYQVKQCGLGLNSRGQIRITYEDGKPVAVALEDLQ